MVFLFTYYKRNWFCHNYKLLLFYTVTSLKVHDFKYLFCVICTAVISFISYLTSNLCLDCLYIICRLFCLFIMLTSLLTFTLLTLSASSRIFLLFLWISLFCLQNVRNGLMLIILSKSTYFSHIVRTLSYEFRIPQIGAFSLHFSSWLMFFIALSFSFYSFCIVNHASYYQITQLLAIAVIWKKSWGSQCWGGKDLAKDGGTGVVLESVGCRGFPVMCILIRVSSSEEK